MFSQKNYVINRREGIEEGINSCPLPCSVQIGSRYKPAIPCHQPFIHFIYKLKEMIVLLSIFT